MRFTNILLIAIAPLVALAAPPLELVFQPDVRNPAQHPGSCLRRNADNTRALFERNVAPGSTSRGVLNIVWQQIHEMTDNAVDALSRQKYNNPGHFGTRKLLYSFFGIMPKEHPDLDGYEYPEEVSTEPGRTYKRKMHAVRANFKEARAIINHAQPDGPFKPKLMCDGIFMDFQLANNPAQDSRGRPIPVNPDNPNGPKWTLRAWEENQGRRFEDNWFFWYNVGTERGYIVLSRRGYPPDPGTHPDGPWPNDARTGQPSVCSGADGGTGSGNLASTLITVPKDGCGGSEDSFCGSDDGGMEADDGAAPWSDAIWIVMCPRSFEKGNLELPTTPPEDGKPLDEQEITALTPLHEIFHITDTGNHDYNMRMPRPGAAGQHSSLDKKIDYIEHNGIPTIGGNECQWLSRWEEADPFTESYEAITTKNPESFAWMAFALWIQGIWDRDFSSGFCDA